MPTLENAIANTASARITTVIEETTALVVPRPRLSVLGSIRRPKWHDTSAIRAPNTSGLAASTIPGPDRNNDGRGDYNNGLHALFRSNDGGHT